MDFKNLMRIINNLSNITMIYRRMRNLINVEKDFCKI